MTKLRSLELLLPPPNPHWVGNGFNVHHFFPGNGGPSQERMSPFLMLDYNSLADLPPSDLPRGVDVHPHRGFETVTISYKGLIAHHDSAGNSGVIGEGDVQWMTAGAGVLHKEYHDLDFTRRGGPFQMVQLWVNLPAAHKMHAPRYQEIRSASMGRLDLKSGYVEIIAGSCSGISGPAATFSPVHLYNLHMEAGDCFELTFPQHYNASMLAISGKAVLQGVRELPQDHFALLGNDGDNILVECKVPNTTILLMAGEPIDEPISSHGPFVMNTHGEILQAFEDFRSGKFGTLR